MCVLSQSNPPLHNTTRNTDYFGSTPTEFELGDWSYSIKQGLCTVCCALMGI
jgi:hypothetical protein